MTKYRVLVSGLTYPTDMRIIRRVQAGENIPFDKRGMCRPLAIGDIVEIPSSLVSGLIHAGWIEEVANG